MLARVMIALAAFGLAVGVEIKGRPPLQILPNSPARPSRNHNNLGQLQVRFPEDTLSVTDAEHDSISSESPGKSQVAKNISVIELLGILHDLPPNETLSTVNQRISSTTESNLETLNRLRMTRLESVEEKKSLDKNYTITTTEETHTELPVNQTNPIDEEETTIQIISSETMSNNDLVQDMFITTTTVASSTGTESFSDENSTVEPSISEKSDNSTVFNFSVEPLDNVSSSTIPTFEIKESHTFNPENVDEEKVSTLMKPEQTTSIFKEKLYTSTSEQPLSEEASSRWSLLESTTSQNCADSLNSTRCPSDTPSNPSIDIVLVGCISGGIFLILVIVISVLSVCLCKRSHNRKNVYATMEEEQPRDFTKVGPPVILQDEVFEAGGSRLYTRQTDKVTEL